MTITVFLVALLPTKIEITCLQYWLISNLTWVLPASAVGRLLLDLEGAASILLITVASIWTVVAIGKVITATIDQVECTDLVCSVCSMLDHSSATAAAMHLYDRSPNSFTLKSTQNLLESVRTSHLEYGNFSIISNRRMHCKLRSLLSCWWIRLLDQRPNVKKNIQVLFRIAHTNSDRREATVRSLQQPTSESRLVVSGWGRQTFG